MTRTATKPLIDRVFERIAEHCTCNNAGECPACKDYALLERATMNYAPVTIDELDDVVIEACESVGLDPEALCEEGRRELAAERINHPSLTDAERQGSMASWNDRGF